MKYCPYCGSGLQDTMVFCPKCGKKYQDAVESVEIADFQPDTVATTAQKKIGEFESIVSGVTENDTSVILPTKAENTQNGKTKKIIILALLCLLVVAIAFAKHTISAKKSVDITGISNSVLYLEVYDDGGNITSTASGFVIDDGTVLITNYHVIENAYHIVAWTADGVDSVDISNILAYDEIADLAVLKCDSSIGVAPLTLGDSNVVKQGDSIYAVGYPLGLANTLSDGVVSSRYVDEDGVDTLQITAAISPGSSGGALLNSQGEVIGAICASYTDGQNLNIAISSDMILSLLSAETNPISMKEFYSTQSRVGINPFNLAQGVSLTQSGDYFFYTSKQKIYCYKVGDHFAKQIAKGQHINAYMGRLYYYDRDAKKVFSCNFAGEENKAIDLSPNVARGSVGISDILVAYGCLFITTFDSSDFSNDFYIYDLESGMQIDSLNDVCNFSYYNDNLYIALRGGGIAGVNMKTFDVQLFETSCSPYIRGISNDGRIYYIDEYNLLENGFYYIDSFTGEEIKNPSYSRESGWGSGWDIWVAGNTVYLSMSSNNETYATYRIESDGSLSLFNDSVFMRDGGYFPELNYYYSYDGTTVDMDTGATIGKWVFE